MNSRWVGRAQWKKAANKRRYAKRRFRGVMNNFKNPESYWRVEEVNPYIPPSVCGDRVWNF